MSDKKPRYKIYLGVGLAPYIEPNIEGVIAMLQGQMPDMDSGDEIRIVCVDGMTDEEFGALPEWMGP